jgi:signal transduction histidine kinase
MKALKVRRWLEDLLGFGTGVLPRRWLVMVFFATAVTFFELYEHSIHGGLLDGKLFIEILLYGILLPVIGGMALSAFDRVDSKRNQTEYHLDLAQELSRELSLAKDWESLKNIVLRFPLKIVPFSAVILLLYDHSQHLLETVGTWSEENSKQLSYPPQFLAPDVQSWQDLNNLHHLAPQHYPYVHWPETYTGFCLPLFHGGMLVALLHLFLPSHCLLTEKQKAILESLASPIALAVDGLHPQGSVIVRIRAAEMESRRLTRYLHDIIGQNIGYLVMQLDQLQLDDRLMDGQIVKQELSHLHSKANEVYEQIRVILTTWQPLDSVDLHTAVYDQAMLSSNQGMLFRVELTSNGRPRSLPAHLSRKILGISREAIMNVRKHAGAQLLHIHLDWGDAQLIFTIQDNGQGFDGQLAQSDRSTYGLKIMKERAEEINGRLIIQSHLTQGTSVCLTFPLPLTGNQI